MADVLKVQPLARVKLQKNNKILLHDQEFAPEPSTYTKYVSGALSIPAAGTVTLSLGGIAAVRNLFFKSDTKCEVKVNAQAAGAKLVGSNMVYVIYSGSITQINVDNDHTTNVASIEYTVTD